MLGVPTNLRRGGGWWRLISRRPGRVRAAQPSTKAGGAGSGSKDQGVLRQWWKARPSRYDAGTPLEERWLFPGRKAGKPMTTRQLNRLFHEAADAAGIKKGVTLHALRHYVSSLTMSSNSKTLA
jgi:site-specific recombinase XerC